MAVGARDSYCPAAHAVRAAHCVAAVQSLRGALTRPGHGHGHAWSAVTAWLRSCVVETTMCEKVSLWQVQVLDAWSVCGCLESPILNNFRALVTGRRHLLLSQHDFGV